MSHIGRNDPCPCGSGRKYKHCCLRASDDVDARRRKLRGAEGRVIPELWRVALDAWGGEGLEAARRRFYRGFDLPEDLEADREFDSLFLTWFALRFAPKRRRGPAARPAAQQWLDDPTHATDPDRRFVAALAPRPLSFHLIGGVNAGKSIDLEDILTGETCTVLEESASQIVKRGGILFARTVTLDGSSILVGCGAALIPPTHRLDLLQLRDALAGTRGRPSLEELLSFDDDLRRAYLTIAESVFNPRPPALRNTDGDPLAPTTVHFDLRCPPADAFEALRTLNAARLGDEPDDPTWNGRGELESFTISWTKPGNKLHREWDNTILGTISARDGTLSASVNSRRRATRLRREIEKRLGSRVMFVRAVEESVEAMLAAHRSQRRDEPPPDPELEAITAEMMDRHWTEWLDTPVPALADQTPRDAAKTPAGRERLSALLDEFEWHSDRPQAPPVARLRAELGFTPRDTPVAADPARSREG